MEYLWREVEGLDSKGVFALFFGAAPERALAQFDTGGLHPFLVRERYAVGQCHSIGITVEFELLRQPLVALGVDVPAAAGDNHGRQCEFGTVVAYDYRIETQLTVRVYIDTIDCDSELTVKKGFGTLYADIGQPDTRGVEHYGSGMSMLGYSKSTDRKYRG